MTKAEIRRLLAKLAPPAAEPAGAWGYLLKNIAVPAITALIGFSFGLATELFKEASAEEKVFLEHRMKVYVATGTHYEAYRLNWSRLIEFAKWEWEQSKQDQNFKSDMGRISKYVADRDAAKDLLFAQFRAADLFFSHEVSMLIVAFRAFDSAQSQQTVETLPPMSHWDAYYNSLVEQMRKEVRK